MTHLSDLERTLLAMLVAGDHPALTALREQFAVVQITSREFSGVGFFTHFVVPPSAPRLPVRRWVISDVYFRMDGLDHGAGALLFVDEGALSMLEAYAYGEDWPRGDAEHSATYMSRGRALGEAGHELVPTGARDMVWLAEEYAAAQHCAAAG
jgi:hypothetical protein